MRYRAESAVTGVLLVLVGCSKFASEKRIDLAFHAEGERDSKESLDREADTPWERWQFIVSKDEKLRWDVECKDIEGLVSRWGQRRTPVQSDETKKGEGRTPPPDFAPRLRQLVQLEEAVPLLDAVARKREGIAAVRLHHQTDQGNGSIFSSWRGGVCVGPAQFCYGPLALVTPIVGYVTFETVITWLNPG
jgi:hypothetical protein